MKSPVALQVTPGAVLVGVGVLVGGYLIWKASGAVGDFAASIGDGISSAADSVVHTVYPDSILAPDQSLSGAIDQRYNTPGDQRSFWQKAWDGYVQDVSNFWGAAPAPEPTTWGSETRVPAWSGGASASW